MTKEITCVICPIGCTVTVDGEGEHIESVQGNQCKRGYRYAVDEFIHPVRILTTSVRARGADRPVLPVRSAKPLPREKLSECMRILGGVSVDAPVEMHQVIVENIAGLGTDMIASAEIERV